MKEKRVTCPVCDGSKTSKVTGLACTRCNATGEIPKELAEALASIRRDLGNRLAQK